MLDRQSLIVAILGLLFLVGGGFYLSSANTPFSSSTAETADGEVSQPMDDAASAEGLSSDATSSADDGGVYLFAEAQEEEQASEEAIADISAADDTPAEESVAEAIDTEATDIETIEKEYGLDVAVDNAPVDIPEPPQTTSADIVIVKPRNDTFFYDNTDTILDVETVLVPHQAKVISSSRDGKISNIFFKNGEQFKRGDLLLEYDCRDLEAESRIAREERVLTGNRRMKSERLFKLDIISDVDYLGLRVEDNQAKFRENLFDVRMDTCRIVAPFNGRITDRLANPGEYTRTDRVLLQIASDEPLQAEFLIPSKWLRWVDVGAPLEIIVNETGRSYQAAVTRIYGEVDPVSQSIQIVAKLDPYQDPLLPGMSGVATLDIDAIRAAGISGFLEPR